MALLGTPQISTGFFPHDETRSFSVDCAAKWESAGFPREAFRPGFWGVPNKAIFQSEGFFEALQRADRTTPTHTHKMRATAYISRDFSQSGATKHFLVEFVKQNKPQIAGKQKRILQGRYPHFGAKRLPMYPKINGIPAPQFESRKTDPKNGKDQPQNCNKSLDRMLRIAVPIF